MKNLVKTLSLAGVASFISVAAYAENYNAINTLPERGTVNVQGIVESLDGKNTITLNDDTGRVSVVVKKDEYENLRVGERVKVLGTAKSKDNVTHIQATSVVNAVKSKAAPAESSYINDGNSTGEDLYKGERGNKR